METKVFKIIKATDKFMNIIETEYIPKAKEFADKIEEFNSKLFDIIKGNTNYTKEELDKDANKLDELRLDIENNIFKDYGGIKHISSYNNDCFKEIIIRDSEKVKSIFDKYSELYYNNKDIANKAFKAANELYVYTSCAYIKEINSEYKQLSDIITESTKWMFSIPAIFLNVIDRVSEQ
jgi:hypothetical protein